MSLQHQDKSREHRSGKSTVEFAEIKGTDLKVSRVGLGTWAIGGSMWGGTDEVNPIETIRAALATRSKTETHVFCSPLDEGAATSPTTKIAAAPIAIVTPNAPR